MLRDNHNIMPTQRDGSSTRRAGNGRDPRIHRVRRSGRRHGQGGQCRLDRHRNTLAPATSRCSCAATSAPSRPPPTPGPRPRDASASSFRCTSFLARTARSNGFFRSVSQPGGRTFFRPRANRPRPRLDQRSAQSRAPRQAGASHPRRILAGADRRRSSTRWRLPQPRIAEPLARLAVEETTYGVVADKIQKNLFGSQQVYEFIQPMKTVGVIARHDDKKDHRDRRALRRRGRHRAVDQSDLDGDLQDPHQHQGPLRHCHVTAPVGRTLHHPDGGDHVRRRARRPGLPTARLAG